MTKYNRNLGSKREQDLQTPRDLNKKKSRIAKSALSFEDKRAAVAYEDEHRKFRNNPKSHEENLDPTTEGGE